MNDTHQNIKSILLQNLILFHNFCYENKLNYFLCGGTLIGTVRHNGFIPWDDDIDVMMPRKDYELFLKKFKNNENIELITFKNNTKFKLNFAKLTDKRIIVKENNSLPEMGVAIDIFPIDGVPNSIAIYHIQKTLIFLLKVIRNSRIFPCITIKSKVLKFFSNYILFFISSYTICLIIDNLSKLYSYENSKQVSMYTALLDKHFPKAFIEKTILKSFENYDFFIPSMYHDFLSFFYGDYMTIPKLNERVSHNYLYVLKQE